MLELEGLPAEYLLGALKGNTALCLDLLVFLVHFQPLLFDHMARHLKVRPLFECLVVDQPTNLQILGGLNEKGQFSEIGFPVDGGCEGQSVNIVPLEYLLL
jgi:hypothetical protein